MRYHVQRITTRKWLTRDLELHEGVTTRALSSPGGIAGVIAPEMREYEAADGLLLLEPWASVVYAEESGTIRGAGIVTDQSFDGPENSLDLPGFTYYPQQLLYSDSWPQEGRDPEWPGTQIDPTDAMRHLWQHVQSFPDGDLGMVVDATTTDVRIGDNADPYRLRWWENVDVGAEIDSLASETPFDYDEVHRWTDNKGDVTHRLRIGYPRLGRRRTDLRFVEGENVTNVVPIEHLADKFANEIIGIGEGEGSRMAYHRVRRRDGRLRRTRSVTDKTASQRRIERISETELRRGETIEDIGSLEINDHPNARIAEIQPGDDILADVLSPHLGRVRIWVRVLAIAEADNGYTATLSTQRSSDFVYSSTREVTE